MILHTIGKKPPVGAPRFVLLPHRKDWLDDDPGPVTSITGPDSASIDHFLTGMMRDARYSQRGPDGDAYRGRIGQLWQHAYPGQRVPGSWGRDEQPTITLRQLREETDDLIVPASAPSGAEAAPPSPDVSAPTPDTGPDLTDLEDNPGKKPNKSVEPVQVAFGPLAVPAAAAAGASGLATLGLYGMDNSTRDRIARSVEDAISGEDPRMSGIETFPEDRPEGTIEAFPDDPVEPDIEAFPDQSALSDGFTLVFPDKTGPDGAAQTPPSEDQSGSLPQGTILKIEDSSGNHFNIDVSGSSRKAVQRLTEHLDLIPNEAARGTVRRMTDGGILTTAKGSKNSISNISMPIQGDQVVAAEKAFDDLIRSAGGDPRDAPRKTITGNHIRRHYIMPEGTRVEFRTKSTTAGNPPTSEIRFQKRTENDPYFKIRYQHPNEIGR